MTTNKLVVRGISLGVITTLLSLVAGYKPAFAELPGKHPHYLHALSDLRAARWLEEHRPGDAAVSGQEDVAIQQINAAIREIKQAAIDDGKNINDHPSIDVPKNHHGRLHRALELLSKAHFDVKREEDDPTAIGLRNRSIWHIDAAIRATRRAIYDIEHHI